MMVAEYRQHLFVLSPFVESLQITRRYLGFNQNSPCFRNLFSMQKF
jgi:hypothetical protein